MRLPERDVADSADAEDCYQPGAVLLEIADLLSEGWQLRFVSEMALLRRDCQLAERTVETLFHRILEGAGVVRRQRIVFRVGPLIHVETVDMVAGDAPFAQEIDGPAIHPHRTNRENERDRAA